MFFKTAFDPAYVSWKSAQWQSYFAWGRTITFSRTWDLSTGCVLTSCVKLDTDVKVMLLSVPEFGDSRCSDSHRLFIGVNVMLPCFLPFRPVCMKFGKGHIHKNVLIDPEFRENRCIESYNLLKAQVNLCANCSRLLSDLSYHLP
jgi:hypothetical protein